MHPARNTPSQRDQAISREASGERDVLRRPALRPARRGDRRRLRVLGSSASRRPDWPTCRSTVRTTRPSPSLSCRHVSACRAQDFRDDHRFRGATHPATRCRSAARGGASVLRVRHPGLECARDGDAALGPTVVARRLAPAAAGSADARADGPGVSRTLSAARRAVCERRACRRGMDHRPAVGPVAPALRRAGAQHRSLTGATSSTVRPRLTECDCGQRDPERRATMSWRSPSSRTTSRWSSRSK